MVLQRVLKATCAQQQQHMFDNDARPRTGIFFLVTQATRKVPHSGSYTSLWSRLLTPAAQKKNVGQSGMMSQAFAHVRTPIAIAAHGTMDATTVSVDAHNHSHSSFSCYSYFRYKSSRVGRGRCGAAGNHSSRCSAGYSFHTFATSVSSDGLGVSQERVS